MALGGGTFVTQNKVLPGSYINFVSTSNGSNVFGERGTGAIGMILDWHDGNVRTITREDFQKNSLAIFGYEYSNSKVAWVRDFFKNGKTLIFGALNTNGGVKASNTYCTAKCYGTRGNSIKTVIQNNVDVEAKFDVLTYMGATLVDSQTVATAAELKSNDYVTFKNTTLAVTAGTALTGGADGTVSGKTVQNFLTKLEGYSFNAMTTCDYESDYVIEWTKRMRDEVGLKFQCVVYDMNNINYEGCVVTNCDADVMPWVTGAIAGCEINKSLTNKVYDGEYYTAEDVLNTVSNYSQIDLENFINQGIFSFHRVGDEVRVLMDINSLTEFTEEKGEVFKDNQTIRVCDQIANDIAAIFNNYYLGKVPNDTAGRSSLKSDIVKHHQKLQTLRAIEGFTADDITVEIGENKRSVVVIDNIVPINAMTHLYMTVNVE